MSFVLLRGLLTLAVAHRISVSGVELNPPRFSERQFAKFLNNHSLRVSDGASVGFWTLRATSQWDACMTVLMLPTYSVTAYQWMKWFGPAFVTAKFNVVVLDYRGFGLSVGPWKADSSPTDEVYNGFRASRFAADAHEIMASLRLHRPLLLAHSYGNVVAAHLISLFKPDLLGYALLDQSPKLTNIGLAADPTFSGNAVFNLSAQEEMLNDIVSFSKDGVIIEQANYPKRLFHYPRMADLWNNTFKSIEGLGSSAHPGCCVCYSENCLHAWAEATDYWSEQNGQVVALTMWDNFNHDWTDVLSLLQYRSIPVFVYGGRYSLISFGSVEWVWRKLSAKGNPKSRHLFFLDEFGVHSPWLNPPPTCNYFMDNLTDWAATLAQDEIIDLV